MSLIVIITNKSNLASISDYNYEVLVGDGTVEGSTTLERGRIEGHRRDDGWRELVRRVVERNVAR